MKKQTSVFENSLIWFGERVNKVLDLKSRYGLVVQLVRTLACHARGREFESLPGRHLPL